MAQMRENRTKRKLQRGEVTTGVTSDDTPVMIDFLGSLGWDSVWIDAEHGPVDFGDVGNLSRACDLWGMTSLVRVNLNFPGVIYRVLDQGAQGVIVPHVNTEEEARAVVDAAKFAPIGHRGSGGGRQGFGVEGYFSQANEMTLVTVMIEEVAGLRKPPRDAARRQYRCLLHRSYRPGAEHGLPGPAESSQGSIRRAPRYRPDYRSRQSGGNSGL